jgi:hypothetical protein
MVKRPLCIFVAGMVFCSPPASALEVYLNCNVPVKPTVKVDPVSDEIKYDFSVPSRDLSPVRMGAAAASAYPAGTDVVTGGLRWEMPATGFEIETAGSQLNSTKQACLWYNTVSVKIRLSPHIYIANEFSADGPCKDAIMEHELHHVDVDREMMNKYSQVIGEAVQKVVGETGAVGPIDPDKIDEKRDELKDKVKTAIRTAEEPLQAEMREQQAQVDSPEEYQRVSAICKAEVSAMLHGPTGVAAQGAAQPNKMPDADLQNLKDRAAQGDAAAQNELGDRYYKGNGVAKDSRAALQWYMQAAQAGYAPAQASIVTVIKENPGITGVQ